MENVSVLLCTEFEYRFYIFYSTCLSDTELDVYVKLMLDILETRSTNCS